MILPTFKYLIAISFVFLASSVFTSAYAKDYVHFTVINKSGGPAAIRLMQDDGCMRSSETALKKDEIKTNWYTAEGSFCSPLNAIWAVEAVVNHDGIPIFGGNIAGQCFLTHSYSGKTVTITIGSASEVGGMPPLTIDGLPKQNLFRPC